MDTTDLHFEDPRLLAVAAAAGLVLFVALRWTERRRRRGLTGFASATLLGRLVSGFSAARRLTKDAALAAAFALLVACFAGPGASKNPSRKARPRTWSSPSTSRSPCWSPT